MLASSCSPSCRDHRQAREGKRRILRLRSLGSNGTPINELHKSLAIVILHRYTNLCQRRPPARPGGVAISEVELTT